MYFIGKLYIYHSMLQYTTFYDTPICLLSYNVKVSELVDIFMGSAQKAVSLLHEDPDKSKDEINVCKTGFYLPCICTIV